MDLAVKERLVLLNILPSQETYANMLIVRDLIGELGFSEADHKSLGLKEDGKGNVTWDDGKETVKAVAIGPLAYELIKKGFKKLDSERAITHELLPFYERFVEGEAEVEISSNGVVEREAIHAVP